MRKRRTKVLADRHVDRRTFLKAVGLGGVGLMAAGTLSTRWIPFVTPVAAQTGPIDDLALSLGFDPERVFRFVAEEIRYEPYPGLLRGPEGTLVARAGNSVDQAALLAALLRASGIDSRFARLATTIVRDLSGSLLPRAWSPREAGRWACHWEPPVGHEVARGHRSLARHRTSRHAPGVVPWASST